MKVIQMPMQICLIPYLVLPKPPLPNGVLPVSFFGIGHPGRLMHNGFTRRENPALIKPHRLEKSPSPSGNVQIQ